MCQASDLKARAATRPIKSESKSSSVAFKQGAEAAPAAFRNQSNPAVHTRTAINSARNTNSNSVCEDNTSDDVDRVCPGDRELAKTIVHLINDLHRNIGKKNSLLADLLRIAARDGHCNFLETLLEHESAGRGRTLQMPVVIKDDDDTASDSFAERQLRSRSGAGNATVCSKGSSKDAV